MSGARRQRSMSTVDGGSPCLTICSHRPCCRFRYCWRGPCWSACSPSASTSRSPSCWHWRACSSCRWRPISLSPQLVTGAGLKELLVNLFLPILIFEAALGLSTREFMRNLVAITALATVALVISAALVGVGLSLVLGMPILVALLFGADLGYRPGGRRRDLPRARRAQTPAHAGRRRELAQRRRRDRPLRDPAGRRHGDVADGRGRLRLLRALRRHRRRLRRDGHGRRRHRDGRDAGEQGGRIGP
ncbi:MAG: hypothetical protein GEU86_14875 [Actinophytocola sp.]|nr:hypothetical protein [Actinophytocola sp.]